MYRGRLNVKGIYRLRHYFWSELCLLSKSEMKFAKILKIQPWESAAAFGNVVVNVVLCWFYDSKKNAVIKVFTYFVFLFRFYSVADNS